MIAIVDYGMGNLASIANMFRKLDVDCCITSDPVELLSADRFILPGVGAFDRGMAELHDRGLVELLTQRVVVDGVPTLGICLGMQLLCQGSEEGERAGLGWIDADVVRFRPEPGSDLKVPHMGWNVVHERRPIGLLSAPDASRFYFVHSYRVVCHDERDVWCTTPYGAEFTSALAHENIVGVQFHPEKSHRFGLELLRRFATSSPDL